LGHHKRPEVEKRLARIEGHVHGIRKMLEEDRSYSDIVHQISATISALESVNQVIVDDLVEGTISKIVCYVCSLNILVYRMVEQVVKQLKLRNHSLELGKRTLIMGILNITPDSFSGDGIYEDPEKAVARALTMM